jgi:hypothetical protein
VVAAGEVSVAPTVAPGAGGAPFGAAGDIAVPGAGGICAAGLTGAPGAAGAAVAGGAPGGGGGGFCGFCAKAVNASMTVQRQIVSNVFIVGGMVPLPARFPVTVILLYPKGFRAESSKTFHLLLNWTLRPPKVANNISDYVRLWDVKEANQIAQKSRFIGSVRSTISQTR